MNVAPNSRCWPSREVECDGQRRLYLDSSTGAWPVIFLHGIPSHHIIWREVLQSLDRDIRAIAPDLTGFGLSDLPDHADVSPGVQARDVLAFLDQLGIEHFGIVAHDYGALVACAMVALAGDRVTHLAITNTSLRHQDWSGSRLSPFRLLRLPLVGEAAFRLARRFMLKRAYAIYVAERDTLENGLMDELWAPFENGFDRTLLRLFRQDWGGEVAFARWRETLAGFDRPCLITWGALDPTFTVARAIDISSLAPDAVFVVLRHSNHFVQLDAPQTLAGLVNQLIVGRGPEGDGNIWQPAN